METPEQAAERLFGEALDVPCGQRGAFVERACAGVPQLRRMVEHLLDENDRLSGFLSAPLYGSAQGTTTAAASPLGAAGTLLLERYRIVEWLGAGGMGVVYRRGMKSWSAKSPSHASATTNTRRRTPLFRPATRPIPSPQADICPQIDTKSGADPVS
jgi:hypothetical protein